ncbi:hypothetical protein [Vibrio penaeicida]|uniref:hypothetical protein n=1 Tax=Vibrio penaeicida TaxID=104609 RepID=UPI000CEA1171|nr:hypothetical protein [Vibrio penaeicida]
MLSGVKKEITTTPISSLSALFGAIIAGLALYMAWLQYPDSRTINRETDFGTLETVLGVNISNTLVIISFYVSLTVCFAILTRYLSSRHSLGATFLSIVLAAVTNFLTMVVIYLSPPRELDHELFVSANDLVLYSSLIFYLMFCGRAVLIDLLSPEKADDDDKFTSNIVGGLWFALIMVVIWCKCVFVGQELLSETFLPPITHPSIEEVAENA